MKISYAKTHKFVTVSCRDYNRNTDYAEEIAEAIKKIEPMGEKLDTVRVELYANSVDEIIDERFPEYCVLVHDLVFDKFGKIPFFRTSIDYVSTMPQLFNDFVITIFFEEGDEDDI